MRARELRPRVYSWLYLLPAYAERFHNQPVEPSPPSIDFDTKPYARALLLAWFTCRKLIFEFLDETVPTPRAHSTSLPTTSTSPI